MVDIRKSPADDRVYLYKQLGNGVKCLAISDLHADMSAAAMSVKTGSLNDPRDVPGLAHFLEHMLFLGSEKYPNERNYLSFIRQNSGNTDAFTSHTQTNYYFTVANDKLEPALDIFAQFFLSPLFDSSCVDREIHAVDSEFTKNINNDMWRQSQLLFSLACPTHPLNRFGTGNINTLQIADIRARLIAYYGEQYAAGLMAFVVLGKEDVNTLMSWCEGHFSKVSSCNSPQSAAPIGFPFDKSRLGTLIKVASIMDKKEVRLVWQFPSIEHLYASKPQKYLSHLIGHEGRNSILSMLKAEGLALELNAGCYYSYPEFALFRVSIDLTDKGMGLIDTVLEIVYQYIQMLHQKGVQEWIFEEIRKTELAEFQFKPKTDPMNYTSYLAGNMHKYPPAEVITAPCLVQEYHPEEIRELLTLLKPDNMMVFLVSKAWENECTETEQWYGTRYSLQPLPQSLLSKLTNPSFSHPSLVLDLPPSNRFIPDLFPVLLPGISPLPSLILETDRFTLFHKQDDTFHKDTVFSFVQLLSADAGYVATPEGKICGRIYVKMLKDYLRELTYLAEMGGFVVNFRLLPMGIGLEINGFSQHYGAFLTEIFTEWAQLSFQSSHEAKFQEHADSIHRELENYSKIQPYQQVLDTKADVLLASAYHTASQELRAMANVDFQDFLIFSRKWLKTLRFEWLFYGNIEANEAARIATDCVDILSNQRLALLKDEVPCELVFELPLQRAQPGLVLELEVSDFNEENSCIYVFWQAGMETISLHAQLLILENIISAPCFLTLRTEKQLGYIVWTLVRNIRCSLDLGILIQSHVASPSQLTNHIEDFLSTMRANFKEMTDESFETHKESAYKKIVQKDVQPAEEFARYVNEMTKRRYMFNKREKLGKAIKGTNKEEVKGLFERLFYTENRRIDLQLVSANLKPQHTSQPTAYKSVFEVRRGLATYPACA